MDVVRSNFEEVFPQIEEALQKCEFVGMVTYVYSHLIY
jgi:hypothetical protein